MKEHLPISGHVAFLGLIVLFASIAAAFKIGAWGLVGAAFGILLIARSIHQNVAATTDSDKADLKIRSLGVNLVLAAVLSFFGSCVSFSVFQDSVSERLFRISIWFLVLVIPLLVVLGIANRIRQVSKRNRDT